MTVLISPLYRKLLYLFHRHAPFGMLPVRDSIPDPCHRLQRHCSSYKSGLVTASELVNYWTDVFERNEIPEAEASSQYIVSHVLGAKTVKCCGSNHGFLYRRAKMNVRNLFHAWFSNQHVCALSYMTGLSREGNTSYIQGLF